MTNRNFKQLYPLKKSCGRLLNVLYIICDYICELNNKSDKNFNLTYLLTSYFYSTTTIFKSWPVGKSIASACVLSGATVRH